MITLRLDPNLEQEIISAAKKLGLTKSDLIRKSILDYLGKVSKQNAWDNGYDLFGKYSSGHQNLSTDRKEILKNKIKARRG